MKECQLTRCKKLRIVHSRQTNHVHFVAASVIYICRTCKGCAKDTLSNKGLVSKLDPDVAKSLKDDVAIGKWEERMKEMDE